MFNGYDFWRLPLPPYCPRGRNPSWCKLVYFHQLLQTYEFVFYLSEGSFVRLHDVPLHKVLDWGHFDLSKHLFLLSLSKDSDLDPLDISTMIMKSEKESRQVLLDWFRSPFQKFQVNGTDYRKFMTQSPFELRLLSKVIYPAYEELFQTVTANAFSGEHGVSRPFSYTFPLPPFNLMNSLFYPFLPLSIY
jgi:hypothetical protein